MDQKMKLRQKAMASMMSEDAPLVTSKKPAPQEPGQEGMESMMVTPEEKQMILDSRGEGDGTAEEGSPEIEPEIV